MIKELQSRVENSFVKFEGEKRKISFPTLKKDKIVKVSYEFDSVKKILVRKEIPLEDIIEKKDIEGETVLVLDDFSLSYFYFDKDKDDYDWKDSWEEEDNILGVEIKIKVKGEEIVKKLFF
jgi:hypothetical protein